MFKLNFKIALRNLWKNKGFSLINIGGLAIGLASCMVLLLYVAYEWSYDKQFTDNDKTYIVYQNSVANGKTFSWAWTPNAMAKEVEAKIPGVKYASHSTYPNAKLISYGEKKISSRAVFADPSFVKIFDYKFIKGSASQVLKDVNSIILTKSFAEKLFGNEDPINKSVKLENEDVLKVAAIIEDVPANTSIYLECIMPWQLFVKRESWVKEDNWGNNMCLTVVQLKDNNFFDTANAQMHGIYKRNQKGNTAEALLHPLTKWHLYSDFENGKSVGGKIDQLKIFLMLAFCILLIACVNFMNLSTARSEGRAKEVGVRKAIGSSRRSLINQFLLESVLLTVISTVLAFILVEISVPYFNNLLDIKLEIDYSNSRFWITLLLLMVVTGLVAGSYPALYLSSFEPIKVLKGFRIKTDSSVSVRKVLVVGQFVFAACLIVCTSVIYQQLSYVKNKPIGYNKANLVQIAVQGKMANQTKLDLIKAQLLKSGAVSNVTFFSQDITESGNNTTDVSWKGKIPGESILFNNRGIGGDFIKTIGTELVAGREFLTNGVSDTNSVMLNEAAVKMMRLKDPIGATIRFWGNERKNVGIVKDFVVESAYQKVAPMIFFPSSTWSASVIIARLNPDQNLSSSLEAIDAIVKGIEPNYPVNRKFVDEGFEIKFKDEKLLGTLSNWFGGFSIFISCLGLLGLALFMAEQRKKEISIRKVLGASTANILALLNKEFIKLVAIANLIAFPLAYIVINQWLSAFEYRITISVLPFALAVVISLLIAFLTVSIQSVKVAKANPIDALKYE
ncbi:ABC transporter permease [Pedobacter insulae]|uniref:ABC-type transport system, involved in lipoprotein release, permease component n=1 Tax=Pedobacter insulae TaxID=414048 RepID=A0A1I2WJT5_9SPHI|nr:ABC transporter permease [Pedobacter insulae]SFH01572.1 ABC-type transport system, involved in lipoprotein release, permease component [Pedobacter insulae]